MPDKKDEEVEKVLSEEILSDARRRAERTIKRAERSGGKILDRAKDEAEKVRDRVLEQAETRMERERHTFDSTLTLEERMRRLKAQGELLDEVFARALEHLEGRDGVDCPRVVRELAVEAVLAMTGDAFVVRLGPDDLKSMKGKLPAEVAAAVHEASGREVRVSAAERAAPITGGVIVETADGRQRFDNSFAGRLRRMADELRFEVAQVIFGADDEEVREAGEEQT